MSIKARILLINPPFYRPVMRDCHTALFPIPGLFSWHPADLLLQSAFMAHQGILRFLDAPIQNLNFQDAINSARDFRPDLVISLISRATLNWDLEFLRILHSQTQADTAVIGDEARLNPEQLLEKAPFISRIINDISREASAVPGRYIPPVPHHLLTHIPYRLPNFAGPFLSIVTSLGCSGGCLFCDVPVFYPEYWKRDVQEVIEEINRAVKNTGITQIFFRDATFNDDPERLALLLTGIIRECPRIRWTGWIRPSSIDREMAILMRSSGADTVHCGIETADRKILGRYGKSGTPASISSGVRKLARANIGVCGHFMLGLSGENRLSRLNTFRLARRLPLLMSIFNAYTIRPGTPEKAPLPHPEYSGNLRQISPWLHSLAGYHAHPDRIRQICNIVRNGMYPVHALAIPAIRTILRMLAYVPLYCRMLRGATRCTTGGKVEYRREGSR